MEEGYVQVTYKSRFCRGSEPARQDLNQKNGEELNLFEVFLGFAKVPLWQSVALYNIIIDYSPEYGYCT